MDLASLKVKLHQGIWGSLPVPRVCLLIQADWSPPLQSYGEAETREHMYLSPGEVPIIQLLSKC